MNSPSATSPLSLMQRVANFHLYGCDATEPPYGRACSCGTALNKLRLEVLAALSTASETPTHTGMLRGVESLLSRCLRYGLLRTEVGVMLLHIQAVLASTPSAIAESFPKSPAASTNRPENGEASKNGLRQPSDKNGDNYVGWCRYLRNDAGETFGFEACDSDALGAFKVYRATPSATRLNDGDRIEDHSLMLELCHQLGAKDGENMHEMLLAAVQDALRYRQKAPREVMVCGVDCHPGDNMCNGYCDGEADKPPRYVHSPVKEG